MTTRLFIEFPEHPQATLTLCDSRGQTMQGRARPDTRPTGLPTRLLSRAEWDDQRKQGGYYLPPGLPHWRAVPDVDFEAEDGTIHKTAEDCLRHDLKSWFGVESLNAVKEQLCIVASAIGSVNNNSFKECLDGILKNFRRPLGLGPYTQKSLHDANGNPPFSGVPEQPAEAQPAAPTDAEAVRLLTSALSRRGLKPAEAAKATGLTSQQCRELAASHADKFREHAGKIFLKD